MYYFIFGKYDLLEKPFHYADPIGDKEIVFHTNLGSLAFSRHHENNIYPCLVHNCLKNVDIVSIAANRSDDMAIR